ncbi:MAG: coproporphyrinogen III oxidase, partial [Propionibacteriaceae bacterium]|nr:coproporphyrinogen III oxidase [Propionibacteriaceae bacterium]
YAARLADGSPAEGAEHLSPAERRLEALLLGIRLADGLDRALLTPAEAARADGFVASGHLVRQGPRFICTLPGRLLADGIIRDILD